MRPAHKLISAGVWKFESGLVSHFEAALFREHPNLVLRPLPFRRSPSDSQLLSFPKGKGISLCQQNFMLEISLSKLPTRSSSSCLVKLERFNLQVSWKTAIPDAREALPSSKCPARKKQLQRLSNSMARNLVVAP